MEILSICDRTLHTWETLVAPYDISFLIHFATLVLNFMLKFHGSDSETKFHILLFSYIL